VEGPETGNRSFNGPKQIGISHTSDWRTNKQANQQNGKDLKAVSLGTSKGTHKANPQRKSIALANRAKRQKFKKLFRLELQRHTPSKSTKGNLLYSKQAKRQRFKKLFRLELANPQRKFIALKPNKAAKIKKLFHLELQSHYQANPQREIYCTPNQAKRQRFKKLFRLELQRHTLNKATKEIYCTCKQGKAAKIKKRSRCFVFDVD